jgi:hypothetical protein
VRPGDWQWGASVQQELLPRVAVEVGYQRRWLVNQSTTDNRARSAADHDRFSFTAPADSRLPNGGGQVVSNLYNVNAAGQARLNDNYQTLASNIGAFSQVANSINANLTARTRGGLIVQGGINSGVQQNNSCEIREALPETALLNPYCETTTPWITRVTALGSYTIPKVDVQISGTLRSDPGGQLAANYTVANATTTLGRPFNGTAGQTVTVNLVQPGTLYGNRVNQVDMRFAKVLRFGRTRATVGIDLYNIANSDTTLTYNQTFIPTVTSGASNWLRPTSVLHPRYMKIGAQIDF